METDEIYILDEKIPYTQLKAHLDKASPFTKEQVVDLIISKINDQDEDIFKRFKRKYEKLSFKYYSSEEKKEKLQAELSQLEDDNDQSRTWSDPKELKTDLLNENFQFFFEDGKKILYNRQIAELSSNAANLLVVCKKRSI